MSTKVFARVSTGRARRPARLVSLGLVGACSGRPAQSRDASNGTSSAAASALAQPIVITDQRGVKHTFTKPVRRIVTTVIPSPSMITAIDQSYDRIVGVNQATINRDKGSVFAAMFPQALTNTAVSGPDFVPNVETIAKLKPDVVIQWSDQGDPKTLIDPIEAAGYPVIGLTYCTQKDLETWIDMFATLLDKKERGQELLKVMHDTLGEIETFKAARKTSPTALFLRAAGNGGYNAGMSSKLGYMNTWMTVAGATNVGADVEYSTTNATSVEQLITWNPDVIFVSSMTALTPAKIYADPALAGLSAVKNKRVYAVPSGGFWWDPPSAESNLMMLWATQVLYPGTANFGLRAKMKEHYSFLYGHTLTEDEIDQILKLDVNSSAAGYGQFAR